VKRLHEINARALAFICLFTGIATTFLGYHDLRTIQRMADPGYMDWLTMAGVTSLGFSMLALATMLLLRQSWAGFVALAFIGITSVAFIVGAFHVNLFWGIGLLLGLVFVVGINLRSNTPV
jgi:hypothetical protein